MLKYELKYNRSDRTPLHFAPKGSCIIFWIRPSHRRSGWKPNCVICSSAAAALQGKARSFPE